MVKSMTGYGKATCQLASNAVSIELKSLNSKTLDISMRIPGCFKSKEQEIRSLAGQHLGRGKIELVIAFDGLNNNNAYALNKALIEKYYRELSDVAVKLDVPVSSDLIPAILRLPEVIQQEAQQVTEEDWQLLFQALKECLQQCDNYRITEGASMGADLKMRIGKIAGLTDTIRPLEENRRRAIRTKLIKGLESLSDGNAHDPNRFEQELLYYIEKLDITEELVRMKQHLAYFVTTMSEPAPGGKKLTFIAQEIGREINTVGSKANDAAIQKIVVEMKDELEKIKEQLMNIL